MAIFSKTATLTSSELSLKANNILGVFRKTIDGLNEVISQAKNQAEVKHQEAEAALAEEESLMNVAEQNQAILTKLTELLNNMVWRVNLDGDRDGLLIRFALKGVRFDSDALLFNRSMENKIKDFESKHKLFFDYLLDDTWLCEKPITSNEVASVWSWMIDLKIEITPICKFEEVFKISFADIAHYWNKHILKLL